MTSKKIFIVRHGETDYNKNGMVQGRGIDAPLNETGHHQADAFFEAYGDQAFDKIYISSLQRTEQSVAKFIAQGIPYEKLSGLDEISWGSQEGREFDNESTKLYYDTVKKWMSGDLDLSVGGGESPNDVMQRQKQAMDKILEADDEKVILICMHGRAMRILLSWLLGYSLTYMDHFEHHNLGLYELTYNGTEFALVRLNDLTHLQHLASRDE